MRRRLLSLAMALAMALSLLPTVAWAEEEQPPAGSTVSTEPASNKETQGTPTETSQPVEVEKDVEGSDLADVEEQAAPSNGTVPVPTPASEEDIKIPGGTFGEDYTVSTEEDGVVTVTLTDDIPLTATWTIASGETVVLDLKGHALTADGTVAIKNEGTLTIQDSSNGNGKVSGLRGVDNYGDLTLKSGIITTEDTTGSGGCVFMRGDNATFFVKGGKLEPVNDSVNAIGFKTENPSNIVLSLEGGTIGKVQLKGSNYVLTIGKENGETNDVYVGDIDAITSNWVKNVSYEIILNSGTVASLPNKADTKITYGGTFGTLIQSNDASTLPGGYKFESVDGSGYHLVVDPSANPVSIISNDATQNYPSMGQALAALQEGDTLRLNQTYQIETSTDCIVVSVPNVTLDLNGFNIEMTKSIAYSPVQVDADGGTFRIINSETTPAKVQPYQPDQPASYTVAAVSAVSNGSGIVTVEVGENITLVNHVELGGGARTKAANLSEERENLCTVQVGEGGPDGYIYSFNDLDAIASLRNADTPVTVTLLGNATVGVEYTSSTVPMVVDLEGYTVSAASGRSSVISIPDGHDNVNLTVQNGTISGDSVSAASVLSEDCTLILDGLTMTSSGDFGIAANGSKRKSERSSAGLNLTVRNCSLTNCSLTNDSSSQESQGTVGIFFPAQEGTLTVENSQITGYNVGVQAFTGNITISGDQTKITGSGETHLNGEEGNLATSGPLFDGAAVSIIQRVNEDGSNPYGEFETVTIDGGTFTTAATGDSAHGALHVSRYMNTTSGGYTAGFENKPDSGTQIVSISGGSFSNKIPSDYCAPGMVPSTSGGTYTVTVDSSVATDGNGTEASPYIIRNVGQLKAFRDKVNSGASYEGVYFALVSGQTYDISDSEWEPIGITVKNDDTYTDHSFKGHFDGNGATITGLTMTDDDLACYNSFNTGYACYGFFGGVDGGTVENLRFTSFNINTPGTAIENPEHGDACNNTVAVAVGAAVNGTHISGITIGTGTVTGASRAAGVVGYVGAGNAAAPANSDIPMGEIVVENCVNYATITSNWKASTHGTAGGICATVNAYADEGGSVTFQGNTNNGNVSGYYAAGICASTFVNGGQMEVTFNNNTNNGTITATGSSAAGVSVSRGTAAGIAATVQGANGTATYSLDGNKNTGAITSDGRAAGVVAVGDKYIVEFGESGNTNRGYVTGVTTVGGVVDQILSASAVENLTNYGTVISTGDSSEYKDGKNPWAHAVAGGVVGYVNCESGGQATLKNLTNHGAVSAATEVEYDSIGHAPVGAGGVVGEAAVANLSDLTNTGAVTLGAKANADCFAGGVVGRLGGDNKDIENSEATLDGGTCSSDVMPTSSGTTKTPYLGKLVGEVRGGQTATIQNVSEDDAIGAVGMYGSTQRTVNLVNVNLTELDVVASHTQEFTYTIQLENSAIGTMKVDGAVHTGMTLEISKGTVEEVVFTNVTGNQKGDEPIPGTKLSVAASDGARIGTVDATDSTNKITLYGGLRVAADENSNIATVRTSGPVTVGFEHSQSDESTANTDKEKFPNTGTISAVATSGTYTLANIDGETNEEPEDVLYLADSLDATAIEILNGTNETAFNGVSLAADATAAGTLTIANDRTLVIQEDVTLDVAGHAIKNNGTNNILNYGKIINLGADDTSDVITVVSFQVTPVNAEVVVKDDSGAEVFSSSVNEYHLENGAYTYTVSLDGYVSQSGSFTVNGSTGRTFTIGLQPVPTPVPDDDDDRPSSGGSSTPSYSNTIEVGDGGDVKVSPRTPEAGDTVTITPDPDAGYEVDKVIVTDRNGDEVEVTANRNGTYTFEQPRGRVTIEVTFVRTDSGLPFIVVAANAWYYDAEAYA